MYSTCLFCNKNLGSNEAIEHFPVGRRLAFDSSTGRLWVVCRACERWNLTPLEERWEALEECERAFEGTRLRVSTDHIGLARIKEGLDLVRIGKPKRPEFAAWRYGDQFGRRRRKHIAMISAGTAVVVTGLAVGEFGFGLALGVTGLLNAVQIVHGVYVAARRGTTIRANGELLGMTAREIDGTQLLWSHLRNDWSILVPRNKILRWSKDGRHIVTSDEAFEFLKKSGRDDEAAVEVQGDEARRALGKIMARVNSGGGKTDTVQSAVSAIEESGDSTRFLERSGQMFAANRRLLGMSIPKDGGNLKSISPEMRLAMEMAANEENERDALLGELKLLEEDWRTAEEIAGIADKLLVSRDVQENLDELKSRSRQN